MWPSLLPTVSCSLLPVAETRVFAAQSAIVLPGAADGAVRSLVVAAVKESVRAVALLVRATHLAVER